MSDKQTFFGVVLVDETDAGGSEPYGGRAFRSEEAANALVRSLQADPSYSHVTITVLEFSLED